MTSPVSSMDTCLVVSDFDDTLKISHTTNRLYTVFRGLFTRQAYACRSPMLAHAVIPLDPVRRPA